MCVQDQLQKKENNSFKKKIAEKNKSEGQPTGERLFFDRTQTYFTESKPASPKALMAPSIMYYSCNHCNHMLLFLG
jgi:hypothetical protein